MPSFPLVILPQLFLRTTLHPFLRLSEMLSRANSIFHVEDDEAEGEKGRAENELINGGILSRRTAGKGLVGLQILISKQEQEANYNIVIKSSKKICKKPETISVDFLKFCFFCSKELSLQKEVYMYRYGSYIYSLISALFGLKELKK